MTPSVFILYGSQTGCAESIAKRIYDEAIEKQIEATLAPLNDFQNSKLLEQHEVQRVIIVCSTTGNGEPPDNCAKFWRYIKRRTQPATLLENIMYTVMGLGDTNYDKFCYMGKSIEKRMRELGAQSFFDMCAADEAMGLEDQVEPWLASLWPAFFKSFGVQSEIVETSSSSGSVQEDSEELMRTSIELKSSRPYLQSTIVTYDAMFGTFSSATETPTDIPRLQPSLFSVQPVDASVSLSSPFEQLSLASTSIEEVSASHPFASKIRSAKYLTKKNVERKVLYMEIDITGSHLTYQPGDSVGIKCPNRDEDVSALLKRLELGDGNQLVSIEAASSSSKSRKPTINRFPSPCSVKDLFLYHVDILVSPKKAVLCALSSYCSDPEERARMLVLSSKSGGDKYTKFITEQQLSVIEILYLFPSCQPPLDHLLSLLPPLMPRFYSIATSPLNDNGHLIGIAFTIVHERVGSSHSIERFGLCTNWLHTISKPLLQGITSSLDIKVPLFLRPTRDFTLPASLEWPLIMIGPGTGVAPFMGFLAHRYHQISNRRQVASQVCCGHWRGGLELTDMEEDEEFTMSPAHAVHCKGMYLFYGCRHRDEDWLFREEMNEYLQNGTLHALFTAFSREDLHSLEKHYVQREIRNNGALVADLILQQGGYIYVCGDGMHMAKDVHDALRQVLEEHAGLSMEEAETQLKELMTRQRYVRDIW